MIRSESPRITSVGVLKVLGLGLGRVKAVARNVDRVRTKDSTNEVT
jgi:hypothetical protein